jgi:hypothetical protein
VSRSSNQKRKRKTRRATGVPCESGHRDARREVRLFMLAPLITSEDYVFALETGRLPSRIEVH